MTGCEVFVLAFIIRYHVTRFEHHPLALVISNSLILVLAGAGQFAAKLLIAVGSYDCDVSVMGRFHARIVAYFTVAAVGCIVNRLMSVLSAPLDHLRLATQPSSTTSDMKINKENAV